MTDNTTLDPRKPRHAGLQHVSIPLAEAIDELLQRAAEMPDEEATQEQ